MWYLLCKRGVSREFRQVKKLQVQRAELRQDAAPGRCPSPTPTGATATESKTRQREHRHPRHAAAMATASAASR